MKNTIVTLKKLFLFSLLLSIVSIYSGSGFWNEFDLVVRQSNAEAIRVAAAAAQARKVGVRRDKTNGDLDRYEDRRGSFSKCLQHFSSGIVREKSFCSLIHALESGDPRDFNKILLGEGGRLVNPQAAYAYVLEGSDPASFIIPSAPPFASAEAAGEMVELYWGALLRDVPFNKYSSDPIAIQAIEGLNALSCFKGPKENGRVTAQTLWRGVTPGELVGPYISQFFYQPIPENGKEIAQLYYSYSPGLENNFMTTFDEALLIQNGGSTGKEAQFNAERNYFYTGRDLGTFVHKDFPSQAYINAALILFGYGNDALDPNNPYVNNLTQEGFATYGIPKIMALLHCACDAALKTAWYQKWMVHLRLRPEYFGLLTDRQIVTDTNYCIHPDLLTSSVLPEIFDIYGSYLLPQMYPEGSPAHPSYPAGHATVAGACATILKAFFNEDFEIPMPLQPNSDNTDLELYEGKLYVGNELNKLGSNIAMGRNFAGVHYRTDGIEGMRLGENVAIGILCDEAYLNNEPFKGFELTKFNGERVVVGRKVTI